jgi:hypothetical protein
MCSGTPKRVSRHHFHTSSLAGAEATTKERANCGRNRTHLYQLKTSSRLAFTPPFFPPRPPIPAALQSKEDMDNTNNSVGERSAHGSGDVSAVDAAVLLLSVFYLCTYSSLLVSCCLSMTCPAS